MGKITIGLSKIEIGDIAVDGGMGTSLAQLGYTYKDSCSLVTADPETTEHYAEEVDDPVVSFDKVGKTTLSFQVMNPDVDTLQTLLGGTGNTTSGVWSAPATIPVIEKSVKITPTQGLYFEIPRMKLTAKINANFGKSGIFLIDVVGTVLAPTKTGEPKLKATRITTP